jgi:hypothetical protein
VCAATLVATVPLRICTTRSALPLRSRGLVRCSPEAFSDE